MIKTIMFDQGGVLINYNPREKLRSFGYDEKMIDELLERVIYNEFWKELDLGTCTYEQALDIFCERNPQYEKAIRFALKNKEVDYLTENLTVSEFMKELKGEGYNIFILSNFPKETFELIENEFSYFNYVDELIISSMIGMIKPDVKIYNYVINKYGIVPEETIFIDDQQRNLDTADRLGFKTVLFTNFEEVKDKVRKLL